MTARSTAQPAGAEEPFPATAECHRLLLLEAALDMVDRAIKRTPTAARHLHRRADLLAALGRAPTAASARRRALALGSAAEPDFVRLMQRFMTAGGPPPEDPEAHSWLLHLAQFVPELDSGWHFEARRGWAARHADPLLPEPHPVQSEKKRRLRLGYVSADFGRHPTGYFLSGVVPHHDRSRFEIVCYSDRLAEDALTRRIRAAADRWRNTAELDDEALARLVRADAVDVVIDLTGHGFGHRLLALARRPAAIQASWIGSVATTGMRALDWLIADAWEWPPGSERHASEGILRLPTGRLCYAPPSDAPPIADLPANAPVFGCFAKSARMDPATVALWAQILHACPSARLHLKWTSFDDPELRASCGRAFAEHGIGDERLILSGWSPHAALLAAYGAVDVVLDPLGFSGGLTSCEALWMGVPIVTLAGESPARRQTAALLARLGLDDLVADTQSEYLAIALALLVDRPARRTLRHELRSRIVATLSDGAASCRSLEAALLAPSARRRP